MSKATSTLLGRRFLASLREPAFSTTLLSLQSTVTRCRVDQFNCVPCSTSRRTIHSERPFSRSAKPNTPPSKRSLTGPGLLLIGFTTHVSQPGATPTACSTSTESVQSTCQYKSSSIGRLARIGWQRGVHTESQGKADVEGKRLITSKSGGSDGRPSAPKASQDASESSGSGKPQPPHHDHEETMVETMSKYLHMPKMPHRPTREELLAAATGFWQRMRVRFKWASIRSMRPWNIDEWGAFVSWFLFGHIVWILVGTTTFFSLLILSINTVVAQGKHSSPAISYRVLIRCVETLAKWVGDSLTESAGVTVVFESAIVPKWNDGVISFRNVYVSRRPGQIKSSVSKGSSESAAAAAAAAAGHSGQAAVADDEDDGNYTQFDVTIANVNVTLSFLKWWNGKGLLKDVEVKGVRGVVDRTSVVWPTEPIDPFSYRHEHHPGDFEIDSFKLEDLLVTIHQPGDFRPFSVSIFSAELPQLRKQWLFYDFLSATHMSGSFDGSLFTIHPRQVHGTMAGDNRDLAGDMGEPEAWKKFSRLRIDGLKIDHLNRGVDGPFGWIYEGNVDIVADVMFPADAEEGITKVVSDFYDQLEEIVISNRLRLLQKDIADDPLTPPAPDSGHITENSWVENPQLPSHSAPSPQAHHQPSSTLAMRSSSSDDEDDRRYLIMDLRIHLNDVKAAVPLFTNHISYINQALVRPIVAYMNAKKTYIPITCRIVKRASDFDGSWTIFDCALMDDMSAETYEAFARDVENQQSRVRRLKKVGFWTLSLAVHALFMGMAGAVV